MKKSKLNRTIAFEIASKYCSSHGYSVDLLRSENYQHGFSSYGELVAYTHPQEFNENDLYWDVPPDPSLYVYADGHVEETEFTEKYLKEPS